MQVRPPVGRAGLHQVGRGTIGCGRGFPEWTVSYSDGPMSVTRYLSIGLAAWLLLGSLALAQPAGSPSGSALPAAEGSAAGPSTGRPRDHGIQIGPRQIAQLMRGLPGIPMWILVGCCVLTVMFTIERLVVLQRRRVAPRAFTQRLLAHLRDEPMNAHLVQELQTACQRDGSPAAQLLKTVIENHGRSALEIRTAVSDVADMELFHLRTHIRALAGLAATAPLLGLFGTVIGMIEAFQALSQASPEGKSELLAAGIAHIRYSVEATN